MVFDYPKMNLYYDSCHILTLYLKICSDGRIVAGPFLVYVFFFSAFGKMALQENIYDNRKNTI